MYKYFIFALASLLALCSCKTISPRYGDMAHANEKDTLITASTKRYPSASIIGRGANYIKASTTIDHPSTSTQSIDGASFAETTGVISINQSILFDFNSDNVKDDALPTLKQIATAVSDLQFSTLQICGHTDNIGSLTYNQALSERRAKAVANKLFLLGLPEEQLETFGRGSTSPIADNKSSSGRSRNRRVEIRLVK